MTDLYRSAKLTLVLMVFALLLAWTVPAQGQESTPAPTPTPTRSFEWGTDQAHGDVEPLCAPDLNHYAFSVYLYRPGSDYRFEWSMNHDWSNSTIVQGFQGDNQVVTGRDEGTVFYVRWASDKKFIGSNVAKDGVCPKVSGLVFLPAVLAD